jgi:ankyrin repeat protein
MVWCLVELGADVDKCDDECQTALIVAAIEGNLDMVLCLVELGASIEGAAAMATPPCSRMLALVDIRRCSSCSSMLVQAWKI